MSPMVSWLWVINPSTLSCAGSSDVGDERAPMEAASCSKRLALALMPEKLTCVACSTLGPAAPLDWLQDGSWPGWMAAALTFLSPWHHQQPPANHGAWWRIRSVHLILLTKTGWVPTGWRWLLVWVWPSWQSRRGVGVQVQPGAPDGGESLVRLFGMSVVVRLMLGRELRSDVCCLG